jgi:hypothetical protein
LVGEEKEIGIDDRKLATTDVADV